jgi:hypothetical protein
VAHLEGASVTIAQRVAEEERLYGSVTAAMIAEALESQGFIVDKKQLELAEPIKKLGTYEVTIRLAPEVQTTVTVVVVPKTPEGRRAGDGGVFCFCIFVRDDRPTPGIIPSSPKLLISTASPSTKFGGRFPQNWRKISGCRQPALAFPAAKKIEICHREQSPPQPPYPERVIRLRPISPSAPLACNLPGLLLGCNINGGHLPSAQRNGVRVQAQSIYPITY